MSKMFYPHYNIKATILKVLEETENIAEPPPTIHTIHPEIVTPDSATDSGQRLIIHHHVQSGLIKKPGSIRTNEPSSTHIFIQIKSISQTPHQGEPEHDTREYRVPITAGLIENIHDITDEQLRNILGITTKLTDSRLRRGKPLSNGQLGAIRAHLEMIRGPR